MKNVRLAEEGVFSIRKSVSKAMLAAGLPQSKGLWPDSPLHSSLRTQYLCVSFDINNDAVRVSSLPKNLQ
jgi:hypothetical protein